MMPFYEIELILNFGI